LTELSAAAAIEKFDSHDPDSQVANLARRMLHIHGNRPSAAETGGKAQAIVELDLLEELIPMENAIRLALRLRPIKGSEVGKKLESQLKKVRKEIKQKADRAREEAQGKPRRGLLMYDQIHKKAHVGGIDV